jgi:hypothetical protein
MNLRAPDQLKTPAVFGAFFGIAFAAPLLLGISDRAASFAGGLTAALAAVVAVVLTGQVNRENERAKEKRATAAVRMRALRHLVLAARKENWILRHFQEHRGNAKVNQLGLLGALADSLKDFPSDAFEVSYDLSDALPGLLSDYDARRKYTVLLAESLQKTTAAETKDKVSAAAADEKELLRMVAECIGELASVTAELNRIRDQIAEHEQA